MRDSNATGKVYSEVPKITQSQTSSSPEADNQSLTTHRATQQSQVSEVESATEDFQTTTATVVGKSIKNVHKAASPSPKRKIEAAYDTLKNVELLYKAENKLIEAIRTESD